MSVVELTPVPKVSLPPEFRRKKSSSVPALNQAWKLSAWNSWPAMTPLFAMLFTDQQQGAAAPFENGFMLLNFPFTHTHPPAGNVPLEDMLHSPPTTVPALLMPNGTVLVAVGGFG